MFLLHIDLDNTIQLEGNDLEHNSDFGFKIKINMSGKKETSTKLKEEMNV